MSNYPPNSLARILLILALILAAAWVRLLPHPPNATPVSAVALFGGATLPMPWSLIVPLTAMVASDVVIGFDSFPVTLAVYGSFIATALLGRRLRHTWGPWRLLGLTVGGSVLFYLVTNAAVWKFSHMYPPTLEGLWLSYYYGLPFFRYTLMGDIAYTFSLFLAAQWLPIILRRGALWFSPLVNLLTSSIPRLRRSRL